jgi:hypothetical protein
MTALTVRPAIEESVAYEVTAPDGTCQYRGADLELACDIHDQSPEAHLVRLVADQVVRTYGERT